MANLNLHRIPSELLEKMRQGRMVRLIYLGSSNTQRRQPGMHWGDWLELGLKKQYLASLFQAFNVGVGGQTSRDLLERFHRDVTDLHPDAVLVTVGGNDSGEMAKMSDEEYRGNLMELYRRASACGAMTIFQTYYGCDIKNLPPERGPRMIAFMQIKREVAATTGSPLIDQFERWQPLMNCPDYVKQLLADPFHTTDLGNAVMGLNLLRAFECPPTPDLLAYAPQAVQIDALLQNAQ